MMRMCAVLAAAALSAAGGLWAPAPSAAGPLVPPGASGSAPAAVMLARDARSYRLGALLIEGPWARATPGGAQVAGGYVRITNTGSAADRLVGGSLTVAASVEVHEMAMTGGVMKMRRLDKGLEIGPGQTLELKPGGYHLMFMGLRRGLKQGETLEGTLVFEKAGSIGVEFSIAPIGAQAPGGSTHKH
jgi:copper(I)-binding protein